MSASLASGSGGALEKAAADLERIRELKSRIAGMERTRLETRSIATLPAFSSLLPGGALQAGCAYSVGGSMTLLMGLLSGASQAGAWCGVVGVPEFGAEAATRFGIDLSRLVLVPRPGRSWLAVTAALADALTVVVTRPFERVGDADAAKLAARLRQRGAVLISFEPELLLAAPPTAWPGAQARLTVTESRWSGIGRGHGYPRERLVTVRADVASGRPRIVQLRLPGDYLGGTAPQAAPLLRLERVS
ncbi:hypothetical protein [Gryllotalpicola ginsengisoli]|uniref:hypothetical protein n=1 Tax=Gryllotalpicola ginsengisoli TaxID=444608 RepID=UPI0003B30B59|nr:hypothetical protein [Gryllotalpicola ginsengisoli]